MAAHSTAHARSHPVPRARHARCGCIKLFLLRRYPKDQRRHRHHPAIHCAGVGPALRGRAWTTETLAALLASFSFAFYNVGGHRILARYDRWRVLTWTLVAASVFWLVVNPPWRVVAAHYAPAQWGFLFAFSMISVLGSFSLYFFGLQHLEPTRAIIASCLEPVFSILLAAALLGEGVRPIQTLGIVLVLSAIVIVQLPGRGVAGRESVVVDPIE